MAARTISVAGGDWNSIGTWDEGAFPVAGDTVTARAGGDSGNVTINVASACASMILTNYVGTMTFDAVLTTTSTVTLVAGMTVAGTAGGLNCTGTATLTSGGKTLTCPLTLSGTATYTLADDWIVNGLLTIGASTTSTVVSGFSITAKAGYTVGGTTGSNTGTTRIIVTGGTIDMSAKTTGTNQLDILVDSTGTITFGTIVQGASKPIIYKRGLLPKDVYSTNSLQFNGTTQYCNIDAVRTARASDTTGTWSAWVRTPTPTNGTSQEIIAMGDTDANSLIYLDQEFTSGKLRAGLINAATTKWTMATDAIAFSKDTWTHVAVTHNATAPILYVNGTAVAQTFSVSTDKTPWISSIAGLDNCRIGDRNYNSTGETLYYSGLIDEVSFWDTALSAGQITELYNSGKPADLTTHTAYANLKNWFRMGESLSGTTLTDVRDAQNGTIVNMTTRDVSTLVPGLGTVIGFPKTLSFAQ